MEHGLAQAVMNMSFGNQIGFQAGMEPVDWYADMPGAIVAELTEEVNLPAPSAWARPPSPPSLPCPARPSLWTSC